MTPGEILSLVMIIALCGFTLVGFPISFTLGGVSLIMAGIGAALGIFDVSYLGFVPNRIYGTMTNEVLIAIPLFVFMGVMLERSKVAEELLDTMGRLFGNLRGGLAISVTLVGALLAASTGIVGATVVTMGLISLPTMLRRGYDPALACGSITAAGTLGQIIPPSIVLVILGDQISNAYQVAQRELGNFSPEPVSVGDLFAGALIPGLALVGMYVLYQILVAWLKPSSSPAIPKEELGEGDKSLASRVMRALVAPLVLIVAVLGSILAGVATPTEAAAVGAIGATLLGGVRLNPEKPWPIYVAAISLVVIMTLVITLDLRIARSQIAPLDMLGIAIAGVGCLGIARGLWVSLLRVHRAKVLKDITRTTARFSSMIFVIIIGAGVFSVVFRGFGGDVMVQEFLSELPGGVIGAVVTVMILMFVLGFFLDVIEITFVVVPIVAPALLQMGLNPVWLGIMFAVNLQTSFLTPPLGYALFYLRAVAPAEVKTTQIYRGVVPFVVIQLLMLIVLAMFPAMTTWLPRVIFG
ncbi:MAG: TRAP transporter large permease subunit [Gammaproteobacteria bacterium]|nr:MAG: TRAP transporter large permease subunit [Gammaproteobacteria bacterium]